MRLIDTHCHLNDPDAFEDVGAAVREAQAAGVSDLVVIGVDDRSSRLAVEIALAHDGVWAVVGWHPNSAHEASVAGLARIGELVTHPKVVGWGEIGLDYHWDFATREEQRWALEAQRMMAEAAGKPVVFHCREAYGDLLDWLEAEPLRVPFVLHCFAGTAEDAARAARLGAWFGVDGPVTYKKAEALRAVVAALPRERVLLETDAPWMSPVPHRGERNRPSRLPLICSAVAEVWGVTPEAAAALTTANAVRFYGLPG